LFTWGVTEPLLVGLKGVAPGNGPRSRPGSARGRAGRHARRRGEGFADL